MEFKLNDTLGSFDAIVEFRGRSVDIRIANEDESQLESLVTDTLSFLTANLAELQQEIVDSLHSMYNHHWCDPANGRPQLSKTKFLAKLSLTTIDVEEFEDGGVLERALTLYYDDGRLFGGHAVMVFWPTLPERKSPDASIAG